MPKKLKTESPKEQAARFKNEAERLIAAGELDPTEAEGAIEQILRRQAKKPG
jgi:hypothetical protein